MAVFWAFLLWVTFLMVLKGLTQFGKPPQSYFFMLHLQETMFLVSTFASLQIHIWFVPLTEAQLLRL